ncbi:hypothetical protein [Heyndrickxia sporothermodurans]|uniref:hypothetical protein n=1 Tax=Heyndrickxia sporothermodurans TaxID=46224 RepID=UPI000D35156B|nr:hypothetical protein [Heyndrickxia sporothermodurans]MBL5769265.1 hypothetical protein [Heyndrickxia sporothermodurans]MBL5772366.1 hypothetical protein [Heyndrickxia sporothermodurans]MBL5782096.1 hypothetical protein [Heyndrickxia sporothermodurans]MBL5786515.1 hypothetical protein [Heyndrickxia sporothermodurans]MBL5790099.1 hypothetical protein [Heyndrickxia sporothermodurans]
MDHLLTCTTEELALMVNVAGHQEIAKGIATVFTSNRTEKELNAIFEATTNQLIMKQIWDPDRDMRGESPLNEKLKRFIDKYAGSKRMIRCSNTPQKSVLMIHHYENNEWLFHLIDRDIIHEFALIDASEIGEIIEQYYAISYEQYGGKQHFYLTDKAFDLLSNPDKVDIIRKNSKFTQQEEDSYNLFLNDLHTFHWTLFNISNFAILSVKNEMYLENILFFLPSKQGIWITEYTEDINKPVHTYLATQEEWQSILSNIGIVAAAY